MAGLAIDTLWYSDKGNKIIGRTTTFGGVSGTFDSGDYLIRDLAWDGTHIWAISLTGRITKFDRHGTKLASYSDLLPSGWGLTFDGTYIWASDPDTDKLYQISLPGLGDITPPAAPELSSDTHPLEHHWYSMDNPTINWTTPQDPSGIGGYSYGLDHSPFTEPDMTSEGTSTTVTFAGLADGTWNFHCRAQDGAGNWGSANHYRIRIDTEPPPAPIALQVIPDGWTNINLFQITWVYPEDSSTIAGSYYKLGSPPTHETDGNFIPSNQLITPDPGEGEHSLYVWLEDGASNRDHTANRIASLRYDGTGPVDGTIAINNGAETTGSLVVTLNDLGAYDGLSGMGPEAMMQFSNDGADWSTPEPVQDSRVDWNLSLSGGTTNPGEKTVFVRYQDGAGNWSDPFSDTIIMAEPLIITTEDLRGGAVGFAYGETLTVTGGVPPYTWTHSAGELPPNFTVESKGIIHGTLREPGTWFFELKVTDSFSNTRFKTFGISGFAGTMRGDLNTDDVLDLLDLMLVVGHILGREELTPTQLWAADAVADGEINIADLVAIAYLIIGREPGSARMAISHVGLSTSLSPSAAEDITDLIISLNNDTPVSGLQMKLRLPPHAVIAGQPRVTDRGRSLSLGHAENNSGLVIIMYPQADGTIAPGSGPIFQIPLSGCTSLRDIGPADIPEMLVVDVEGRLLTVHSESEPNISESSGTLNAYNYPNPFNPDTRITFSLQEKGSVTARIYDILGRTVRTLLDERLDAGVHSVQWDGHDRRGNALPSGVYYCRIGNQHQSQTIPLTLVR